MRLSDFDFPLPEDRIALRPAAPRDAARLLVVRPGCGLKDRVVRDLPDLRDAGKPPVRALPRQTTSGITPLCSQANHFPVRPKPV